jgi:hypothetical protein
VSSAVEKGNESKGVEKRRKKQTTAASKSEYNEKCDRHSDNHIDGDFQHKHNSGLAFQIFHRVHGVCKCSFNGFGNGVQKRYD